MSIFEKPPKFSLADKLMYWEVADEDSLSKKFPDFSNEDDPEECSNFLRRELDYDFDTYELSREICENPVVLQLQKKEIETYKNNRFLINHISYQESLDSAIMRFQKKYDGTSNFIVHPLDVNQNAEVVALEELIGSCRRFKTRGVVFPDNLISGTFFGVLGGFILLSFFEIPLGELSSNFFMGVTGLATGIASQWYYRGPLPYSKIDFLTSKLEQIRTNYD